MLEHLIHPMWKWNAICHLFFRTYSVATPENNEARRAVKKIVASRNAERGLDGQRCVRTISID
jgi:hypothetical protein